MRGEKFLSVFNFLAALPTLSTVGDAVTSDSDTYSSGFQKLVEGADFGERLKYGLEVALIGIAIVFLILVILMAVLYLFKLIFAKEPKKAAVADITVKPEQSVLTDSSGGELSVKMSDKKLVAVVTSAIAASRNESQVAFDVLSIKKYLKY
ncbi:MAG: hypothetical protein CVU97_06475 [Firmicutes bacterium HGW-Firmicutes-21]|nr:MAG: hypothetical protein CVU97_06475 [Firmicutes bacterium HGW-Firmicutes-21]